jgi:hypothetical protein
MRRVIAVAVLALVLVALVAAPAMAQRDPFEPLIDPNAPVGAPGDPAPGTDPEGAPPFQPTEQVPNTGANTTDWTAGAYILMVLGGALLMLGRLYRNPEVRHRA